MRNLGVIRVLPNPYLHLDDTGTPVHAVAVDPSVNTNRQFVGAVLDQAEVIDNIREGELLSPRQFNTWKFTDEPVSIMLTDYYRNAIQNGELLIADKESAKRVGMEFVEPSEAIKSYRESAAKKWNAAYGEFPSWYSEPPSEKRPASVTQINAKKSAVIPNETALNVRRTTGTH
jgi:hypothetical protein